MSKLGACLLSLTSLVVTLLDCITNIENMCHTGGVVVIVFIFLDKKMTIDKS